MFISPVHFSLQSLTPCCVFFTLLHSAHFVTSLTASLNEPVILCSKEMINSNDVHRSLSNTSLHIVVTYSIDAFRDIFFFMNASAICLSLTHPLYLLSFMHTHSLAHMLTEVTP